MKALLEEMLAAYRRSHEKEAQDTYTMHQTRQALSRELDRLHQVCWNMSPNASYGLGYDSPWMDGGACMR